MTEETAKALADAMNRLAAALEAVTAASGMMPGGIHIWHHNAPRQVTPGPGFHPNFYPVVPTWPYLAGSSGAGSGT